MRRAAAVLAMAFLASCAWKATVVSVDPQVWILPISALDSDRVCAITMDYPGRRCTTVGDIRSYLRSVKAD